MEVLERCHGTVVLEQQVGEFSQPVHIQPTRCRTVHKTKSEHSFHVKYGSSDVRFVGSIIANN